jgi:PAS domain S-box-containing protein
MTTNTAVDDHGFQTTLTLGDRCARTFVRLFARAFDSAAALVTNRPLLQLAIVFLGYVIAGNLGQATTAIRSGNLGPVWPASGIALAGLLAYGLRAWPAVLAGSFVVAFLSPVPALTAFGQSLGATAAAAAGAFLLQRLAKFEPRLSNLRDTLAVIIIGAFGCSILSASIGLASLYASGLQPYSGLGSAWLIYWLGDATGVLLVTPLIFTLSSLLAIRSRKRLLELVTLLTLLVGACLLVFGDLPLFSVRLHVLAFSVLPFVMWAAISFGAGGSALSVFVIATMATLLTAAGFGPFSAHTAFVNAALLDVLFTVLAVSGLALAAVIAERERAEAERERLVRVQAGMETRLRLAAIVESSNDAIVSMTLDGTIENWNAAAHRMFGFTEAEAVGQPAAILMPAAVQSQTINKLEQLRAGKRIEPYETLFVTKGNKTLNMSVTISPITNVDETVVGAATILRDITENKRSEAALSNLSRRLIETQEQERARIARELHDDIGQRLALVASRLAARAEGAGRADAGMIELGHRTSEIAADVQAISHRLHSPKLELLGMAVAMRHFCSEFAGQQKMAVEFESHEIPDRVSPDISLCLFRILQEALHNAAKHSGGRRFEVEAASGDGQLHLVVRDHGRGFDVETAKRGRGIGLVSMEERIKLVHGDLSIESQLSRGTTIHARVPLWPSHT